MADVQTNLYIEMIVDLLLKVFEVFMNQEIVQNFAENIVKNYLRPI